MKNKIFIIVTVISLLILTSLACGGTSNTGVKVETTPVPPSNSSEQNPSVEQAEPTKDNRPQVFKVGDTVELGDQTIRLNSVEYQANNILLANFSVVNKGNKDIALSSLLSFTAKDSDGTKLDVAVMDCSGGSLDGKVLPGDKLKGNICWSGARQDSGIKIYYEANLFGSGAVVFDASQPGESQEPKSDTESSNIQTYKMGEIIKVQDHTIVMNSSEIQGNILKTNFTIENQGTTDLIISSVMNFSAKDAQGNKLEIEIMSCGGSSLDGKILPNDKLKGDICWAGAQPNSGLKIYYDASLFGSGAIVWSVP